MVRAAGRKVFALEFAEAALSETDRLRRAGELEADLRKLFRVLSLPGSASGALEVIAVLTRPENDLTEGPFLGGFMRITKGKQPDHAAANLARCRWALSARMTSIAFFIIPFSQTCRSACIQTTRCCTSFVRCRRRRTLIFRDWFFHPEAFEAKRFQARGRDRVLGHDEQAGLARVRVEPARHCLARVRARSVLGTGEHSRRVGPIIIVRFVAHVIRRSVKSSDGITPKHRQLRRFVIQYPVRLSKR